MALMFDMMTVIYISTIIVVFFTIIISAMLWVFRGPPLLIAKALLKKKDILLVNMANNRIVPVIPKVVGDWYYVKSKKKKDAPGGYFWINQKSVTRFGNGGIAFANSHQGITIPMDSLEVMTALQNEQKIGLSLNTYGKLETVIKYGELKNKNEDIPEALQIKFNSLVEEMKDLKHLEILLEKTKEGEFKPTSLLDKPESERLNELIILSKDNVDLVKSLSESDITLLNKAEGQMARGQTTALRSIRDYVKGVVGYPSPKGMEELVDEEKSKMQSQEALMKIIIYGIIAMIGSGIAVSIIWVMITGQG